MCRYLSWKNRHKKTKIFHEHRFFVTLLSWMKALVMYKFLIKSVWSRRVNFIKITTNQDRDGPHNVCDIHKIFIHFLIRRLKLKSMIIQSLYYRVQNYAWNIFMAFGFHRIFGHLPTAAPSSSRRHKV